MTRTTKTRTTAPANQWRTLPAATLADAAQPLPEADPQLTEDIREHGITDPLYVVPDGAGWRVYDGRRRIAAAIAAGAEELPYATRPMVRVADIQQYERNARADSSADRQMIESVRAQGVLVAVTLSPREDGWDLIEGNRRLDAARRAGVTHIPYELDARERADHYLTMVGTARHRTGLRPTEEAAALFQATEAGASLSTAARAAGVKQADARKLIKAGGSKSVGRTADTYQRALTLDEMAELAELEERSPEAAAALAETHTYSLSYRIRCAHRELDADDAAATHRAALKAAGASIREEAELSDKAAPVSVLGLTADEHAQCRGAVWVREDRDEELTPYCYNVDLFGHERASSVTGSAEPSREEAKAARRAVKAGNVAWDAAQETRRQWLAEYIGRRNHTRAEADTASHIVFRAMAYVDHMTHSLGANGAAEIYQQITGAKAEQTGQSDLVATLAKADEKRRAVLALAQVAAGWEARMSRSAWRTDSQANSYARQFAALYLGWLADDLGYPLTPIEQATRDGEPYTGTDTADQDQPQTEQLSE